MYDNTELRILEKIYTNPGIHKRGLSKELKLGVPSIDYALKKINNIITSQESGNQIKYHIDYSKEALTPALQAVEYSRFEKLPLKIKHSIRGFLEELQEKPVLFILFGSHAKDNYTKDSDIDILLVYNKIKNERNIEISAKKISMRTNTKISPVYLDYPDFRESFHNSTKEFFKNLKKDKIILTGTEWWRQLKNEEA